MYICQIYSKLSVDYRCQTLDHNNFRILLWNPETKGNKQEKIKNDPQIYKLIKTVAQKKKNWKKIGVTFQISRTKSYFSKTPRITPKRDKNKR